VGWTAILAAPLFVGQSEAAPAKAVSMKHYSLLLALITAAFTCSSLLAQDKSQPATKCERAEYSSR
jgi:hypothetical protein